MKMTILNAIDENGGRADWFRIRGAVQREHNVENWLTQVRGPLQELLSTGQIVRVASLEDESYMRGGMSTFVLMTEDGSYLRQCYTNNHGPRRLTIDTVDQLNDATVFSHFPKSREFDRQDNSLLANATPVNAYSVSYVRLGLRQSETET